MMDEDYDGSWRTLEREERNEPEPENVVSADNDGEDGNEQKAESSLDVGNQAEITMSTKDDMAQELNTSKETSKRSSWETVTTFNSANRVERRTSRFMSYDLPSAALAFAASPDFERTVICGRDYFKVMKVTPTGLIDPANIRLPQARKIQFPTEVKWGQGDMMIAALGNGTIALFKDGRVERTWMEHHRQVHKLAFNPVDPRCFLSASSDGTIKLWDIREKRSKRTFSGQADAVRDVQFNINSSSEFLAGFDNGTLMVCTPFSSIELDLRCDADFWASTGTLVPRPGSDAYKTPITAQFSRLTGTRMGSMQSVVQEDGTRP